MINCAAEGGLDLLMFDHYLDTEYVTYIKNKEDTNEWVNFEITGEFKEASSETYPACTKTLAELAAEGRVYYYIGDSSPILHTIANSYIST